MRDLVTKWWRPAGAWALTLNASLGFPAIVALAAFGRGEHIGTVAGAYGTVLATWATAVGIRQWGKSNGSESEESTHDDIQT